MPRRLRPYLPGAVFHLTARTQGREKWFDEPMRDFVCQALAIVQPHTDAKLRAYVVMSNHLHVVLQQGTAPLAAFMQPLLCRVALAVKRRYGVDGHVFGRSFWDCVCPDEAYLRSLIAYVHANPVRAGLCKEVADWRWSSLGAYDGCIDPHGPIVEPFFGHVAAGHSELRSAMPPSHRKLDLRDVLLFTLRALNPGLTLEELLVLRGPYASGIRRRLITRAAECGYRGSVIARALGVSEGTVSKVVRSSGIARPRLIVA